MNLVLAVKRKLGLKNSDLAKILMVSAHEVGRWKNGKHSPGKIHRSNMMKLLELKPEPEPVLVKDSTEVFARKILGLRRSMDLSRRSICEKTGLSYNSLTNWEQALTRPEADGVARLETFFGEEPGALLKLLPEGPYVPLKREEHLPAEKRAEQWIERALEKERKTLNIMRKTLSDRTGFNVGTIGYWERQGKIPKYALEKLDKALAEGSSEPRIKIYDASPLSIRLSSLMKERGLTVRLLSLQLGARHNTICYWLTGVNKPSIAMARKLSSFFGEDFTKYTRDLKPLRVPHPVAAFLHQKREERKVKVLEICSALGRHDRGSWEKWMAGTNVPSLESLEKLKGILGLTNSDIEYIRGFSRHTCHSKVLSKDKPLTSDGEWLIKERMARRMTQENLGKVLKRSNAWISNLESGKIVFTPKIKSLLVRKFQKYDIRNEEVDETNPVAEEAIAAACREDVIKVKRQDSEPVFKMAEEFRKKIPAEIAEVNADDKYTTRDKNFISELMIGKIINTLGDAPLRFLNLPHKGREVQFFKDKLNLDMKNSLGIEKDVSFCAEIRKLFIKRGWDMPIRFGDVDKYILKLTSNPFNIIHLDYCGPLTRSKLAAVNHLVKITDKECLVFLTLNTNPRAKYPVFYETGKPPFDAPVAWHQPYFGCNGALMEVFMIHLKPAEIKIKEEKIMNVPAHVLEYMTANVWKSITKEYMEMDGGKRVEILMAMKPFLKNKPIIKESK